LAALLAKGKRSMRVEALGAGGTVRVGVHRPAPRRSGPAHAPKAEGQLVNRSSHAARTKRGLAGASLLALTACGSIADAFRPSPVEAAIMRHYEAHASEQNRRCLNPFMDALIRVDVVEDTGTRLVVDARYAYRDRFMDRREGALGLECSGRGERRFTLARNEDGSLDVVGMSGPGGS
jgi:hypothetical protein